MGGLTSCLVFALVSHMIVSSQVHFSSPSCCAHGEKPRAAPSHVSVAARAITEEDACPSSSSVAARPPSSPPRLLLVPSPGCTRGQLSDPDKHPCESLSLVSTCLLSRVAMDVEVERCSLGASELTRRPPSFRLTSPLSVPTIPESHAMSSQNISQLSMSPDPLPIGHLMDRARKRGSSEAPFSSPSAKRRSTPAEERSSPTTPRSSFVVGTGNTRSISTLVQTTVATGSFADLNFSNVTLSNPLGTGGGTFAGSVHVARSSATGAAATDTTAQYFPLASSSRSFFPAKGGAGPATSGGFASGPASKSRSRLAIEPPPPAPSPPSDRESSPSIFSQLHKKDRRSVTPAQTHAKDVIDLDSNSDEDDSGRREGYMQPPPPAQPARQTTPATTSSHQPAEEEDELEQDQDQAEIVEMLEHDRDEDRESSARRRSHSPTASQGSYYSRADDYGDDEDDSRIPSSQASSMYEYSQASRADEDEEMDELEMVDASQAPQLADIPEEDEPESDRRESRRSEEVDVSRPGRQDVRGSSQGREEGHEGTTSQEQVGPLPIFLLVRARVRLRRIAVTDVYFFSCPSRLSAPCRRTRARA